MIFVEIRTLEITEFEKEIKREVVITERRARNLPKYYASFENSEVMSAGMLCGVYGNGATMDEAIQDYCEIISKKEVTFDAYSSSREEIEMPTLIHTKLLNK